VTLPTGPSPLRVALSTYVDLRLGIIDGNPLSSDEAKRRIAAVHGWEITDQVVDACEYRDRRS
jgi:hypothetical protein